MRNFKITVMGGGTGTFVVLRGLKNFPVDLTAIVTVADSGGSTGRLRSEFGFLPVGDLRQCLAALANDGDEGLIQLLTHRFGRGEGIKGHNVGNLILTALREIHGSEPKALEVAASIFRISGRIYPVSLSKGTLLALYDDGSKVSGEHEIDEPEFGGGKRIRKVFLDPPIRIYSKAGEAVRDSDLIVLGPGDLYTSTVPCLLPDGMMTAIRRTKAKICYVINLMNRFSQAHQYKASDYISELEKYTGRRVDIAIVNDAKIPEALLASYKREKATRVEDNLVENKRFKVVRTDLVKRSKVRKPDSDLLQRSFFRHDGDKLARSLIKILL